MSPQFTSWAYLMYREIRRRFQRHKLGHYPGEKPMSGFYAVLFCMQICEEIDVVGFESYRDQDANNAIATKYHYFDAAVPRPGSHSFDLALYIYRLLSLKFPSLHVEAG
eukprot:scaffold2611_cov356-Prasinococcus_capsulatus_cf.AAC.3